MDWTQLNAIIPLLVLVFTLYLNWRKQDRENLQVSRADLEQDYERVKKERDELLARVEHLEKELGGIPYRRAGRTTKSL